MESNKMVYDVDLVFCIDTTGSMRHVIEIVKKNALNLYGDIIRTLEKKRKTISSVRVRVIAFRDYLFDEDAAMQSSQFFELPEEAEMLKEAVDLLEADGGGDYPESGLEALAYAIRSDWRKEGLKKRQVIVLWTDAAAHPLGTGSDSEFYAPTLPKTFQELSEWWGDPQNTGYVNRHAKRLLMYAPDEEPWRTIASTWDNTILTRTTSNDGLREIDYEAILSAIANSI